MLVPVRLGERLNLQSTAEFCKAWLTMRGTNTAKRYKPIIEGFIASLGPRRAAASIASVTATEIERFRDAETAAGKGATTVNFAVRTLRSVLNQARRKGLSLSNPADAVDLLKASAEEREPFTNDDVTALLKAAGESDWRGMIFFGLHCGFRLHDAANIEWRHLDLQDGTVAFQQEKTSFVKVALHPELTKYLAGLAPGVGMAPLFPRLHGVPSGSAGGLSNAFRQLIENAGVTVRLGAKKEGKGRRFRSKGFHSFRHTFISRLTNADVSPDVRKKMAGHTDDEVHARYSHLEIETQRRAVAKLAWAEV